MDSKTNTCREIGICLVCSKVKCCYLAAAVSSIITSLYLFHTAILLFVMFSFVVVFLPTSGPSLFTLHPRDCIRTSGEASNSPPGGSQFEMCGARL